MQHSAGGSSSSLPARNVQLDVVTARVLSGIYEGLLQNPNHHGPVEEKRFWDGVQRLAASEFKRLKNITLDSNQVGQRRKAALEMARGNRTGSKEVKEAYELLTKEEKQSLKHFAQLDHKVESEFVARHAGDEVELDSEPSSKRKRLTTSRESSISNLDEGSHAFISNHNRPVDDDEDDSFIELSHESNNEGRIISRQISVSALVKYLFEVVDAQKTEVKLLRQQLEEQNAKLQTLMDKCFSSNGSSGRYIGPDINLAMNTSLEEFEFSGLLRSMN